MLSKTLKIIWRDKIKWIAFFLCYMAWKMIINNVPFSSPNSNLVLLLRLIGLTPLLCSGLFVYWAPKTEIKSNNISSWIFWGVLLAIITTLFHLYIGPAIQHYGTTEFNFSIFPVRMFSFIVEMFLETIITFPFFLSVWYKTDILGGYKYAMHNLGKFIVFVLLVVFPQILITSLIVFVYQNFGFPYLIEIYINILSYVYVFYRYLFITYFFYVWLEKDIFREKQI